MSSPAPSGNLPTLPVTPHTSSLLATPRRSARLASSSSLGRTTQAAGITQKNKTPSQAKAQTLSTTEILKISTPLKPIKKRRLPTTIKVSAGDLVRCKQRQVTNDPLQATIDDIPVHQSLPTTTTIAPSSPSVLVSQMLVWAQWRPALYCPAILLERTSRTRQLWKVRYLHWRSERTPRIVSGDQLLPLVGASLKKGDPIHVVRHRRKMSYTLGSFISWSEDAQSIRFKGENRASETKTETETVELARVMIDKSLFTDRKATLEAKGCLYSSQLTQLTQCPSPAIINCSSNGGTLSHTPVSRKRRRIANNPSLLRGMHFWISLGGGLSEAVKRSRKSQIVTQIHALGGMVSAENPSLCDGGSKVEKEGDCPSGSGSLYLLSNVFCRTPKTFLAIVLGVPLIRVDWLDACESSGELLPMAPFAIALPDQSPRCLSQAQDLPSRKHCRGILAGWKLLLEGTTKFKSSWKPVIVATGATLVPDLKTLQVVVQHQTEITTKTRIIMEALPSASSRIARFANTQGISIVNIDWLMRSILAAQAIL